MSFGKIGLSVIGGVLIFASVMNIITNGFGFNANIDVVSPSMFYTGVLIIVLSITVLCAVMMNCTSRIIKEINNRQK